MSMSEELRYILYRRISDGFNEVLVAGPKAPSTVGLVDFKVFIDKHNIHPLEIAQFLKIPYHDVENLVNNISWIEPHAQENLLKLVKVKDQTRRYFCQFLMEQDGKAGSKNVRPKEVDVKDI